VRFDDEGDGFPRNVHVIVFEAFVNVAFESHGRVFLVRVQELGRVATAGRTSPVFDVELVLRPGLGAVLGGIIFVVVVNVFGGLEESLYRHIFTANNNCVIAAFNAQYRTKSTFTAVS